MVPLTPRLGTRSAPQHVLMALGLVATSLLAQPTAARDMTGKAGIGFSGRIERGFRQAPALTFRYWRRDVSFEAVAGFDWDVVDGRLDDTGRFHGGAGVAWLFHDSRHLSATFGARAYAQITFRDAEAERVRVQVDSNGLTDRLDDLSVSRTTYGLLVALPLQLEHFFSDHSSVTASIALTVLGTSGQTIGEKQDAIGAAALTELSGVTVQLAGGYSGGLGYTYYF